jgi:hypothetical protein
MSERITSKFTPTKAGAFGNTVKTKKGDEGERIIYHYLKSVYDDVIYCEGLKADGKTFYKEQINGIDFKFKKKEWRDYYTMDVKNNICYATKSFAVFVDELSKHTNHRMMHVCTWSPWAVEYDRKEMIDFLKSMDPTRNRFEIPLDQAKVFKEKLRNFRFVKIKNYKEYLNTPIPGF